MSEEKKQIYPKTIELLESMAMRSDHGFGLYEKKQQEKMIKKMDTIYEAYLSGKTNKEIEEQFSYSIVTIEQIKEELTGQGFYNPSLLIHKPFK